MAKMTLKVKVNDLHFQYELRVSQDACLVQIWWFQLNLWRVIVWTRQSLQTDGWTDAGNEDTPLPWKAKG